MPDAYYYWGLKGNDIFKIKNISREQLDKIHLLESKKPPIEELRKHPVIIMDFAINNPLEKIDLSNLNLVHSYEELNIHNIDIHGRLSLSISTILDGEIYEIIALCGIVEANISKENFVF